MADKKIKTSVTLRESTFRRIEDYRATIRPIPTVSDAIDILLCKALKEFKKENTPRIKKPKKETVTENPENNANKNSQP